jgi:hypothetical protein
VFNWLCSIRTQRSNHVGSTACHSLPLVTECKICRLAYIGPHTSNIRCCNWGAYASTACKVVLISPLSLEVDVLFEVPPPFLLGSCWYSRPHLPSASFPIHYPLFDII